jgi:hypothetical protein|tara:strand:- start:2396 stop:2533 length:138 start_codon:yes stop_codon:yes gene_type:complete
MNIRVKLYLTMNLIAIALICFIGLNIDGASDTDIAINRALIEAQQ